MCQAQCSAVRVAVWSGVNLTVVKFSEMKFHGGFSKVSPKPCEGERNRKTLPHPFLFFLNNEGWIGAQLLLGRAATARQ